MRSHVSGRLMLLFAKCHDDTVRIYVSRNVGDSGGLSVQDHCRKLNSSSFRRKL